MTSNSMFQPNLESLQHSHFRLEICKTTYDPPRHQILNHPLLSLIPSNVTDCIHPLAIAITTAVKNSSMPQTLFQTATTKDDGMMFWYASFSPQENAFDQSEAYQTSYPIIVCHCFLGNFSSSRNELVYV